MRKRKVSKSLSKQVKDGLPHYYLVRLVFILTTLIISIFDLIGFKFIYDFTLNNLKQTALLTVKNSLSKHTVNYH